MIRAPAVLAVPAVLAAAPAAVAEPLVADLSDHRIEITSGFTGTEVLVFGVRDGAGDIVVALRGPAGPVVVRRKQRRFGVWLNSHEVAFARAPGYYAVASSRPLDEIAPPALLSGLDIGFADSLGRAAASPGAGPVAAFREALVRIMESEGRYREAPSGVGFVDGRLFRAAFALPADVPVGRYRADVLLVADGALAARRTETLHIGKSGFGAAMSGFARSQPLAYGLVAAIVALMAGWTTGMVFRRR